MLSRKSTVALTLTIALSATSCATQRKAAHAEASRTEATEAVQATAHSTSEQRHTAWGASERETEAEWETVTEEWVLTARTDSTATQPTLKRRTTTRGRATAKATATATSSDTVSAASESTTSMEREATAESASASREENRREPAWWQWALGLLPLIAMVGAVVMARRWSKD